MRAMRRNTWMGEKAAGRRKLEEEEREEKYVKEKGKMAQISSPIRLVTNMYRIII